MNDELQKPRALRIRILELASMGLTAQGALLAFEEIAALARYETERTPVNRAQLMLRMAAEYIRLHCPDESVCYDDAECDGHCVADDCEAAAEGLQEK